MHESGRTKLLHGPYRMPRCKVGRQLRCAIRGKVVVRSISDAPIMWPCTRRNQMDLRPSLILCRDLVKAIRVESAAAIKHHFGVGGNTVWQWRKALGVGRVNKGTSALFSRYAPETVRSEKANAKRVPTMHSPERAAKIAAAKRGKPRPAHVIEALKAANVGRVPSDEARANMSAAQKRRGVRPAAVKGPPWTPEEDALLGTLIDRDVAERIGRSERAVSDRRYVLDVPAFIGTIQP